MWGTDLARGDPPEAPLPSAILGRMPRRYPRHPVGPSSHGAQAPPRLIQPPAHRRPAQTGHRSAHISAGPHHHDHGRRTMLTARLPGSANCSRRLDDPCEFHTRQWLSVLPGLISADHRHVLLTGTPQAQVTRCSRPCSDSSPGCYGLQQRCHLVRQRDLRTHRLRREPVSWTWPAGTGHHRAGVRADRYRPAGRGQAAAYSRAHSGDQPRLNPAWSSAWSPPNAADSEAPLQPVDEQQGQSDAGDRQQQAQQDELPERFCASAVRMRKFMPK